MQARPDLPPPLAALACEPALVDGDVAAQGLPADDFAVPAPANLAGAARSDGADGVLSPEHGPDSDESLMHAFAAGDADAFTRLYDRHERATWRFIRHRLGGQHESAADDVLQETWINVARAAPRYVASARFTTWLFTIARNRVIDHLRASSNAALAFDAPLAGEAQDERDGERWVDRLPADAADGPLARIESRQQAEAFLAALDQLPAPQREAFVLQAEGGLSVEEVASATGVGAETAKTRLRYAKAKLRTLLAGWRQA